jgi:hypothetical protein
MLNLGTTIVGTLRQNKRRIPSELKQQKKLSSIHIFRKNMKMVSYVQKEKKNGDFFEDDAQRQRN